jgi:hypothetical protein
MLPNLPHLVSKLIDHNEARWNWDMLNQLFSPLDAKTIGNILICTRVQEDFWARHPDKRVFFNSFRILLLSAYIGEISVTWRLKIKQAF